MKILSLQFLKQIRLMAFVFLFIGICFFAKRAESNCSLELKIEHPISVAVYDYIDRGQKAAIAQSCSSILLLINTPGGVLQTTRLIVEKILNSPIPYLCLIYPAGAHAASAGAIIMQACHVAGAIESTSIGAATPVQGGGQDVPKDMKKKVINDTLSWVEGLIEKRGRSKEFGRDMVTNAKSVGAREALKLGAIDFVATSKGDFLKQALGKEVKLIGEKTAAIQEAPIQAFNTDIRFKVLDIFTDPTLIFFIFMGSLGLLYYEITHPGMFIPGIVGLMGFVISLISFHKLDVSWAGVLLILLGMGFMLGELFVPSFGALGIGGITSFILGGIFLFDENNKFGYELPLMTTVIPIALGMGLLMILLARIILKTRHFRPFDYAKDTLLNKKGVVVKVFPKNKCKISLGGSIWSAISDREVSLEEEVIVKKIENLTVYVTPCEASDEPF